MNNDRRTLIKLLAAAPLAAAWPIHARVSGSPHLSAADEALLDDIQRRGCLFFAEQASQHTGQVLDRAKAQNSTGQLDSRRMTSIAATGFGLSALCIAHQRGYQPAAKIL